MRIRSSLLRLALPLLGIILTLGSCRQEPSSAQQEAASLGWPEVTRETKPWTRWWWPASAVGRSLRTMIRLSFKRGTSPRTGYEVGEGVMR